jgi:hypothetical protein
MRKLTLGLLAILAVSATVPVANAVYLTPYYNVNNGEQYLDTILTTLYGAGNLTRVYDDYDQIWHNPDGTARAKAKYAGYTQDFGYIHGTAGLSFTGIFRVTGSGYNPAVTNLNSFTPDGSGWYHFDHTLTGNYFRFGDDPSGAQLWSSDEADNGAASGNPASADHMITWRITGTSGGFGGNQIGNHVIAWEDQPIGSSDRDYNDVVVEFGGIDEVPEPGTLFLLGVVLFGAGSVAMRRRRR